MKTFLEYLQERMDDDEVADLERRKERNKRSAERKKENLAAREKRYKDSNDKWEFDMIYVDGMEGGKQREEDLAKQMEDKDSECHFEFRVERI